MTTQDSNMWAFAIFLFVCPVKGGKGYGGEGERGRGGGVNQSSAVQNKNQSPVSLPKVR